MISDDVFDFMISSERTFWYFFIKCFYVFVLRKRQEEISWQLNSDKDFSDKEIKKETLRACKIKIRIKTKALIKFKW